MTTPLAELASRARAFVGAVAGGRSSPVVGMPILGPEQPMPTLGWLRCDPPVAPRAPVAGMPDITSWESIAERTYQAATHRTISGEVGAEAEAMVLQVLAGWAAVDALRESPKDERAPGLSRTHTDEGIRLAARLIAPIPRWLGARRKLAEWLIDEGKEAGFEAACHLLLLFEDEPPELGLRELPAQPWASAILALDLYRRRSPDSPSLAALHQRARAGLSKQAYRELKPELGDAPTESSRVEAEPEELKFFIRRSKRPITLLGPSGSGKTRLAKQIHAWLGADKPWIHVNCHALAPNLVEAELFGIEKGVASGVGERKGAFELAGDGVLFLDEIGDAPLELLGKLLTAIEERKAHRVGGSEPKTFGKFRLVFATHADLEARVGEGLFRADLLYRMGRMYRLPSLAERTETDFRDIMRHVFQEVTHSLEGDTTQVEQPDEALVTWMFAERQRLFPGEIRSLRNMLEEALLAVEQRGEARIKRQDLENAVRVASPRPRSLAEPLPPAERLARYRQLVHESVSDNETLRSALGYPATPDGRKAFREWKTRHRTQIEKEIEDE